MAAVDHHAVAARYAPEARELGQGMEGVVYEVDAERVMKIWRARSLDEVRTLQELYRALMNPDEPIRTPVILDVMRDEDTGAILSIEERLEGVPLRGLLPADDAGSCDAAFQAMDLALSRLRRTSAAPPARQIAVLGEPNPWALADRWGACLSVLCRRRASGSMHVLQRRMDRCAQKLSGLARGLSSLGPVPLCTLHGDLCPENVLVRPETMEPIAIVDFGFLTMAGDPIFDAVVSSLIFVMYADEAPLVRRELAYRMASSLGPEFADRYDLYRAAYAFATATAYSPTGEDGHFAWCTDILQSPEVTELLLRLDRDGRQ